MDYIKLYKVWDKTDKKWLHPINKGSGVTFYNTKKQAKNALSDFKTHRYYIRDHELVIIELTVSKIEEINV